MNLPQRKDRRGQPLIVLALILLGWVGVRSALWASSEEEREATFSITAAANPKTAGGLRGSAGEDRREEGYYQAPPKRPTSVVPLEPVDRPAARPRTAVPPRIAAGHQLLFIAGTAFPAEPDELAAEVHSSAVPPIAPAMAPRAKGLSRWSADGWVLWRQGGNGYNLPGRGLPGAILYSGAYGTSQAGLVVRYRLARDSAHRPALFLRASSGYHRPRSEELAGGIALRPLAQVPLSVMGGVRVTRSIDAAKVRPAIAVVTELPPAALPSDFQGEVYAQAGWVGGAAKTPFFDGQARIDRAVAGVGTAQVRIGAAAWGGAQRGTSRLDLGPSVRLDLPLGSGNARLSADYRVRVAGSAAPGNGMAVTFSAGF